MCSLQDRIQVHGEPDGTRRCEAVVYVFGDTWLKMTTCVMRQADARANSTYAG